MTDTKLMTTFFLIAATCLLGVAWGAYNPCRYTKSSMVHMCEFSVVYGTYLYINGSSAKGHPGPCRCRMVFNPRDSYKPKNSTVTVKPYIVPHTDCGARLQIGGHVNLNLTCGVGDLKVTTVRDVINQDFEITLFKQTKDSAVDYCIYLTGFDYYTNPAIVCTPDNITTPAPPVTKRPCRKVTPTGTVPKIKCNCPVRSHADYTGAYFGIGVAIPLTALVFLVVGAIAANIYLKRRDSYKSSGDNSSYSVNSGNVTVSSDVPYGNFGN